jgi:peptidoglycan/LPS O-acetylase OafA/YrhL
VKGRIDYVDGLRAVAILLVLMLHGGATHLHPAPGPPFDIVDIGTHGVDLFFVISGFVLSYPTLAKLNSAGAATFDVAGFFARRIVRIVPPYWAALGVIAISATVLMHLHLPLPSGVNAPRGATDIIRQMFFIQQAARNGHRPAWLVDLFWSLQVEFAWYLSFPLVLWLWVRARIWFWITAALPNIVAFVIVPGPGNLLHSAVLPLMLMWLPFMLGVVAADSHIRRLPWQRWAWPFFFAFGIVAFFYAPRLPPGSGPVGWWGHDLVLWHLAAFFLVVWAGHAALLQRALSWRPLEITGLASYSIYLMHAPLVHSRVFEHYGIAGWPAFFASIAIGMAAGFGFWALVERHFVNTDLRDGLVARLQPAVSAVLRSIRAPRTSQFGNVVPESVPHSQA